MEARAVRLTAEACRRLRRAAGRGRVHSAFAHTVNLELGSDPHRSWISLHGLGSIPAPFGIACEALPALVEPPGVAVRIGRNELTLGRCFTLRLDGARVHDTALPTTAPLPAVAACLARPHATATDGLLPVTAALLTHAAAPSTALARAAVSALERLAAATSAGDAGGCLAAAVPLLGLGPGLTPSGDDCLVGWLAGMRVASARGRRLVATVGPSLLAAASDRTGALSRAFLAAAVAGDVAEPVHAFVTMPDEGRLSALLGLGATSGADLLAGYLLARGALASRSHGRGAQPPSPYPRRVSRAPRSSRATPPGGRTSPRRGGAGEARARSGTPDA